MLEILEDRRLLAIDLPLAPVGVESDGLIDITVTRTDTTTAQNVGLLTNGGTATPGEDYAGLNPGIDVVRFAVGEDAKTIQISIVDDDVVELHETLNVLLYPVDGTAGYSDFGNLFTTVTIQNDDTATLEIEDVSEFETDTGTTFSFGVTLSGSVDTTVSVDYQSSPGTAGAGDFTAVGGRLEFDGNAGETKVISVAVTGDTEIESDEVFDVLLNTIRAGGRDVTFADDGRAQGIILNDDARIDVIGQDMNEDSGELIFTVSLRGDVREAFSVQYATASGTATDNVDFTPQNGSLDFLGNAGESFQVAIPLVSDDTAEPDETLSLQLSNLQYDGDMTIGLGTGQAEILNDDGGFLFAQNVTVNEGAGSVLLNLVFAGEVSEAFSVDVSTVAQTARAQQDYATFSGTFSLSGVNGQVIPIAIPILQDKIAELPESFTVGLANAKTLAGGEVDVTLQSGSVTILDDDTAVFQIDDVTAVEGGNATFTISVSNPLDIDVDLDIAYGAPGDTAAGGVAADYDNAISTVHFAAGEKIKTVTVAIGDDDVVEATETFLVSLSTSTPLGARNVDTSDTGTGTITDNDTASFSIDDVTVNEADGALTFTVTADKSLDIPIDIEVAYGDAGTTAADFDHASDVASFAAGDTSQTVTVAIVDDDIVEAIENFTASLSTSTPLGGRNVDTTDTGTGAVTDDDTATFTIGDVTVNEGDGTLTFTVVTDKTLDLAVDINVAYADGDTAAGDFDHTADVARFAAGDARQTVTVAIADDGVVEATETFLATLSTDTLLGGRSVDTSDSGTGTITDNDTATFSIDDVTVNEGDGTLTFTVVTDKPLDMAVDIDVAYVDVSTGAGDFDRASANVRFATGDTRQTVSVTISNDDLVEAAETFTAHLSTNTPLGGRSVDTTDTGTGTVTDNDTAAFSIDDVTASESDGTLTFTVTTNKALDTPIDIDIAVVDISTAAGDFDHAVGTARFAAGVTS